MPLEVQEQALEKGLIPYIPHDRLIEEMEASLPMTFPPAPALLEALAGHDLKLNLESELVVTEVFDGGDYGGITCSLAMPGKEEGALASRSSAWYPTHPLASKIEEYRKLRLESLAMGMLDMDDEDEEEPN
jgi:hypothetical protein